MIAKGKNRLIEIRKTLGLSQSEFGRGIHLSQSYYAQIEGETRALNDRIAALICATYGVSKDYLLHGAGEMFSESPDVQLNTLLEIYDRLDPPFKECVVRQTRELLSAQEKNKTQGSG